MAALVGSSICACAGAPSAMPSDVAAARAPVPPPHPSVTGCVESRELLAYVLALDAHRRQTRRAALEALGASDEERQGAFGDPRGPGRLDATFEADGRRFAVAAQLAPQFEPRVTLAKQGKSLRRIAERPRAHPTPVLACGVQRCPRAARQTQAAARPLVIELAAGESWGEPLELDYDYWWASVRYDRAEPCTSSPASATP